MQTTRESVITLHGLGELVEVLRRRGYVVVGPKLRDGAIVYDELDSAGDLPAGWTEIHDPGSYRVERRDDELSCAPPHTVSAFEGCTAMS